MKPFETYLEDKLVTLNMRIPVLWDEQKKFFGIE